MRARAAIIKTKAENLSFDDIGYRFICVVHADNAEAQDDVVGRPFTVEADASSQEQRARHDKRLHVLNYMAEFILKTGERVLVDESDLPKIAGINWYLSPQGYVVSGYCKNGSSHKILLHRLLLDAPKGIPVDHRDRDRLNNQRFNLRLATVSTNGANSIGWKLSRKTSSFKGVSWEKRYQKWCVRITVNYKGVHLGYFNDEIEAAQAYDKAARIYFNEYAKLNFSDEKSIH